MDRSSLVARAPLRFNCPCGDARARDLVSRLRRPGARIVDLGCGWGELLLDLTEVSEGARGLGIERCGAYVSRARLRAVERHLEGRVTFAEGDVAGRSDPADVLVAVGASGAFAGDALFERLRARMAPGATLLFADAIWADDTPDAVRATLGDLPSANQIERDVERAGLRVGHHATSTLDEWDRFEQGWRAPFEQSQDADVRAFGAQRKVLYEAQYRGWMGFGWWLLTSVR